jgi:hypothetical protein
MKTSLFLLSILFGGSLFAQTAVKAELSNSLLKKFNDEAKQHAEAPPISFMENKGQIHDQNYNPRTDVLFGAMAGNMAFHLKTTGVSYQLTRVDSYKEVEDERTQVKRKEIDQQTIYRIDLNWLNANTNLRTTADQTLEGYNNYYLASCPDGALNVKSYTGVTVHDLYNGINLHYYEKAGQLKHDYIVAPGANYKQIQILVNGATVSVNEDGSLTLTTPLGKILEGAPVVFQNGKQLKANWTLKNNTLGFEIENYNPNQELIIDPVTRAWGTYYGGTTGSDTGSFCATDAIGNLYFTGSTSTSTGTSIATVGAYQTSFFGSVDAFLVKFNSSGVRQWGTYYGGAGNDQGISIAINATGNVYLSGLAGSTGTVIATPGSHQSTYGGGTGDAFLVQFNSSGVRQWGTFYGGSGNDQGNSCVCDGNGNVYLTGWTASNTGTIIATSGAHQTLNGGGIADAFIVQFNSSGVRQWGSYYGGSGTEYGFSCATDSANNVYMAGFTDSYGGSTIATVGSHQYFAGGLADAFLVKFNSNGVRQWGTFYGDTDFDYGKSCATDAMGNVYLAGYAGSNTGIPIATLGSHQSNYGGGNYDSFLVKFNSTGVRQWGTYYGGTDVDIANSCITDGAGMVYIFGETSSAGTAIATAGAYQVANGGGSFDSFLVKFNTDGVIQWGTFYGGSGNDQGSSCVRDNDGNIYIVGSTTSSTIISSFGAHQSTYYGGGFDAFAAKFSDCPPAAAVTETACDTYTWALNGTTYTSSGTYTHVGTNASGCTLTTTLNLTINNSTTATVNQTACDSYTWALNGTTYTTSGSYTHVGTNAVGCPLTTTLNLTINTVNVSTSFSGITITANASGANYQWINCNNGNAIIPGATAQSFTPTANGSYAVIVTTANCSDTSACQAINSVGIDEMGDSNIEVYPNPTSGKVQIILGEAYQNTSVKLINALGQVILHKDFTSTNEITFEIEGTPGIYFLEIETAEQLLGRIRVIKN